jgi:isoleucyl-tRNA synthetase
MKALELARSEKMIGKSLDAKVTVYTDNDEIFSLMNEFAGELAGIYITSAATVVKGNAPEGAHTETESGIAVLVEQADGEKCDRCWMYTTTPIDDGEGKLCPRCKRIIDSL